MGPVEWVQRKASLLLRPDLINVLFYWSFPDQFQLIKRNKNKNNRKNRQNISWKVKIIRTIVYFLKIIFCFPDFSQHIFNDQCSRGSEKQQINYSLA